MPKILLWGLLHTPLRKKVKAFETQLKNAQDKLRNNEITSVQFLNLLTTEDNNRLVDETWCLDHSRIEVLPEAEDSDEDPDDPGSETVDSGLDSD